MTEENDEKKKDKLRSTENEYDPEGKWGGTVFGKPGDKELAAKLNKMMEKGKIKE